MRKTKAQTSLRISAVKSWPLSRSVIEQIKIINLHELDPVCQSTRKCIDPPPPHIQLYVYVYLGFFLATWAKTYELLRTAILFCTSSFGAYVRM